MQKQELTGVIPTGPETPSDAAETRSPGRTQTPPEVPHRARPPNTQGTSHHRQKPDLDLSPTPPTSTEDSNFIPIRVQPSPEAGKPHPRLPQLQIRHHGLGDPPCLDRLLLVARHHHSDSPLRHRVHSPIPGRQRPSSPPLRRRSRTGRSDRRGPVDDSLRHLRIPLVHPNAQLHISGVRVEETRGIRLIFRQTDLAHELSVCLLDDVVRKIGAFTVRNRLGYPWCHGWSSAGGLLDARLARCNCFCAVLLHRATSHYANQQQDRYCV